MGDLSPLAPDALTKDERIRLLALELAIRMSSHLSSVVDVVDCACHFEAYLLGRGVTA